MISVGYSNCNISILKHVVSKCSLIQAFITLTQGFSPWNYRTFFENSLVKIIYCVEIPAKISTNEIFDMTCINDSMAIMAGIKQRNFSLGKITIVIEQL